MHVETVPAPRLWRFEVTPALVRKLAVVSLLAIYVVVTTGAVVRLTASGLSCDNWPKCGDTPFPEKDGHALIEFGNRLIGLVTILATLAAWLAARRLPSLPGRVKTLALLVFLGTAAQIPLGGLTVILELHPLLVMSHFVLALVVLGAAVVIALEARSNEVGRSEPLVPRELRIAGVVLAAASLAVVLSGAFVTAAGPHSGGSDIRRLGSPTVALAVHVPATGVFGCLLLLTVGYLAALRMRAPRLFSLALVALALALAQLAVGETQYRTDLPWPLVLVHVAVAAAAWATTVALAFCFLRPPADLAPGRPRSAT